MKSAIIFFDEKVEADIKDYMYLNKVNSFSEAVETLVEKGIHTICKEGRESSWTTTRKEDLT